jgi:hypothetical protein
MHIEDHEMRSIAAVKTIKAGTVGGMIITPLEGIV